jgi:hypothetical protein
MFSFMFVEQPEFPSFQSPDGTNINPPKWMLSVSIGLVWFSTKDGNSCVAPKRHKINMVSTSPPWNMIDRF